jgi:hypothetical protein
MTFLAGFVAAVWGLSSVVAVEYAVAPLNNWLRCGNNCRQFATLGQSVEDGRLRGPVPPG